MTTADKVFAILGFAFAGYGFALLAVIAMPPLSGLRKFVPSSWWAAKHIKPIVRAGYMATFGLFVGLQAIDQHLLAVIFAALAIIFAGIAIGQGFRKPGTGADA